MFEEIEHKADYAIRVWGADLPELFADAARGMYALAGGRPTPPLRTRQVAIEAPDLESLLVRWLHELAFIMEVDGEIAQDLEILTLTPATLLARLTTGPAVGINKLIKAVTYHSLAIRSEAGGLQTTIVFDV